MSDKIKVVYEDNHVIVVIKDQNILSQGDNTGDENMVDMLKEYLKDKYNKPGNVYVGLVHRLDRPTGGLMVFAKTSKAASRLAETMKDNEFEKKYLTVLCGVPKDSSAVLTHYLEKNEVTNTVKALTYPKAGAKKAELSYKVISSTDKLSLVEVLLGTGRSHQIRVQMQMIGCPVFGDAKYGGDLLAKGYNLALWAYSLKFKHPVTKQIMSFVSFPAFDLMPWKFFDLENLIKLYKVSNN